MLIMYIKPTGLIVVDMFPFI